MLLLVLCLCLVEHLGLSSGKETDVNSDFGAGEPSFKSCLLPDPLENRSYSLCPEGAGCLAVPGQTVPHTQRLYLSCDPGFALKGDTSPLVLTCYNGQWSPNLPKCQKVCPPLESWSVVVTCRHGGDFVSCYKPMVPGTTATLRCHDFYLDRLPDYPNLLCQENGQWDHPLVGCESGCGVVPHGKAHGVPQQGYPWSAVIFRHQKDDSWKEVCLGTLITPQIVLTVTYCVVNSEDNWTDQTRVGMQVTPWKTYDTMLNVTDRLVRHVYSGTKFLMDLALLRLAESIKVRLYLMPVCVDWVPVEPTATSVLQMFAWIDDYLNIGQASYIDGDTCKQKFNSVAELDAATLDKDTFCANVSFEDSPAKNSYGAGLTAPRKNKHYIVGVFSNAEESDINVFTSVVLTENMDWLKQATYNLERRGNTEQGCHEGASCVGNKTSTTVTHRTTCAIPDELHNRVFKRYNCRKNITNCHKTSGDVLPQGELLEVTCLPGNYLVQGVKMIISCQDGVWDPELPQCYKLCPPLTSHTLDLKCQKGYIEVECDKPMLPGTFVEYSCKPYYESGERLYKNVIKCSSEGTWSRELPYCTASCGVSNLNGAELQPAIVGGNYSRPGNFPWHTAIYHREGSTWAAKCGGTLISTRHVLTAAHCVTHLCLNCKPPPMELADLMVTFGKNYRDWNTTEGTEITKQIRDILVHPSYAGSSINYINDIAVLVLESEVPVSSYVLPACVDINQTYEGQLRRDKTRLGYVAGWGNTQECSPVGNVCNTASHKLKYAQTTIIDFEECFKTTQTIKTFSISRLTPDKFCSGNGSESVVQQGDSGGGLTFEFGGLHYIYGVVSIKLKLELEDKFYYSFGGFSNVSYHLPWLHNILY